MKIHPSCGGALRLVAVLVTAAGSALAQNDLWHKSGANTLEHWGYAVSALDDVNGDGFADVIVGAPLADGPSGIDGGIAFVLSGKDGSVIRWHDGSTGDNLGYSVRGLDDLDGDGVDDYALGAAFADTGAGVDSGAVHLKSGASGATLYFLTGDSVADRFGTSIARLGDITGDGIGDLAIGAPYDDSHGIDSGSVWVRSGATGAPIGQLTGSMAGDLFGASVSGVDDFDGNGVPDLLVGAPLEDLNGSNAGSARVFSGVNGGLLRTFAGDGPNDWLGYSVAGLDDLNGDGLSEVLLGAPQDDNMGLESGMARVFPGSMPGLTPPALYSIDGPAAGFYLGWSVARSGDVSGDGIDDFAVGAPYVDAPAVDAGMALVYRSSDATVFTKMSGLGANHNLGWSVASGGDINDDGVPDLLFGAHGETAAGAWTGGVWAISGELCPVSTYCTAKVNSLGCTPVIDSWGLPRATGGADIFMITASNVLNQKSGILIWSLTPGAIPFGGGTLCLSPPVIRTLGQNSGGTALPAADCSGTYAFNFTQSYMAANGVVAGTTVNTQYWSRDLGFPPPNSIGLTQGLSFQVLP